MPGLVPGIHARNLYRNEYVDGRVKPGHDHRRVPLRQARIIVQITKQARPAINARAGADMRAPSVRRRRIGREGKESGLGADF
jgi:hypothetical protein